MVRTVRPQRADNPSQALPACAAAGEIQEVHVIATAKSFMPFVAALVALYMLVAGDARTALIASAIGVLSLPAARRKFLCLVAGEAGEGFLLLLVEMLGVVNRRFRRIPLALERIRAEVPKA
jgi:hypothetical protein